MKQGPKVTGWTTAYSFSGVTLLLTVQAASREKAVDLLEIAGFKIEKPEGVQRTITMSHRYHDRVKDLQPGNIERDSQPASGRSQ